MAGSHTLQGGLRCLALSYFWCPPSSNGASSIEPSLQMTAPVNRTNPHSTLKDLGTFCNTKPNVHRFTLNLHSLKIMIVESFPVNIRCWGAVVFEKWVIQCHENTFSHVSWSVRRKLFSWHCFTHFSKTTAPQQVIFSGKLSTIIIFKLCKF